MPNKLTGYPSIDKPWLKYYSQEAVHAQIPEGSIYDQLCECNKDNLSGKALSYFSTTYTYRQLIEKIDTTAQAFQNMGVKTGDIVNVALPNIPENIFIVYGLNKIGAIANLIDLRSKGDTLLHYLNETDAKIAVICDLFAENVWEVLEQTSIEKVIVVSPFDSLSFPVRFVLRKRIAMPEKAILWKKFLKQNTHCMCKDVGKSDNVAVILHTSGTTGTPKGVMITNHVFHAMVNQVKDCGMKYDRGERFLNQVPPFLAYNILAAVNDPLDMGLHIILLPDYKPDKFMDNVYKHKANHVIAGPADYKSFLEKNSVKRRNYSFLKTMISGSDKIDEQTKEEVNMLLKKCGCSGEILEGYGMTEVGAAAIMNLPQHIVPNSVGIPLKNISVSIYNNELEKELKYNEVGEICLCGETLMKGYFANSKATQEVMKVHEDGKVWLHTGDMGYVTENGNVFLEGRIKRIIVRHDGQKVPPYQVEDVIRTIANIKECCVVGKNDEVHHNGAIPVAYLVVKEGANNNQVLQDIEELCRKNLRDIYQPQNYIVIDALPLTPNGKVDYRTLENMDYMVTKR